MLSALEGDGDAIACLVERYYTALFGYLFRLTGGDRPVAEDLLQDTFTRVLRPRTYVRGRPVKPWLYAIATNLVRDRHRLLTRRGAQHDLESAAHLTDQVDASHGVLQSEAGQAVRAALGSLGPEQRAAVVLRFYQDLSLAEIADALGIPVGTVKSRLSIALRRLRDLLQSERDDIGR